MCNAACKLADGFHLLSLAQLFLQLPLLRYVPVDAVEPNYCLLRIEDWHGTAFQVSQRSISMVPSEHQVAPATLFNNLAGQEMLDSCPIVFMQ
jgi:hypothetical protein